MEKKKKERATRRGVKLHRYTEGERETVLADVPAKGIVWVDPGSGRIVRTQIEPQHELPDAWSVVIKPDAPKQKSKVVVTYTPDARLGVWVPVTMEESHTRDLVTVTGRARYSNFRRFETTARLKN